MSTTLELQLKKQQLVALLKLGCFLWVQRMAASHPQLRALDEKFMSWYQHMTRESLDISLCLDLKGCVQVFVCCLTGTALA